MHREYNPLHEYGTALSWSKDSPSAVARGTEEQMAKDASRLVELGVKMFGRALHFAPIFLIKEEERSLVENEKKENVMRN